MKKYLSLSAIICLSILACQPTTQEKKTQEKTQQEQPAVNVAVVEQVSAIEFAERLTQNENAQLIDVRTPDEFNQGSIPNAINSNFLDGSFKEYITELDPGETVFVFCASGGRSGKASKLLEKAGFTSIVDLEGGYTAWAAQQQ